MPVILLLFLKARIILTIDNLYYFLNMYFNAIKNYITPPPEAAGRIEHFEI